jgi:cell division protein FtsI (penicillin-binding protein 3)
VGEHELVPATAGHDLVLSIDRSLQFETEQALISQVAASGAAGGVVVVSNPATGEILAMANVRRDPNTGEVAPDMNNAAVTTSYEPGSVMKMITASAAVEEGLVDYATQFTIPDSIRLGEWDFSEHTPHGTVTWPLPQLLSNSSNVGTIQIAQMLGEQRLHDYLVRFGLSQPTALGFPNEQSGSVPAVEDWWGSSMASISLGQSVAVTPLQMLMSYNVVANGGVYVPPRLVLETVAPDGTRRLNPVAAPHRVIGEDTADMMNMMLRGVVAVGTGQRAAVEGYPVAGKTGTARKAQPNGTYVDDMGISRYQATFVGFVPATAPALSIFVMIDEPGDGNIYGGSVAAPVFAEVARAGLRILDIAPPATDRAERFADALPAEARGMYEAGDSVAPRASETVLGQGPDGRVRALPVGASRPQTDVVQ